MEYLIYTYGGGEDLVAVFNAIAMLFKSDSTYLTPVGSMAMTLGGVYAAVKATFKGDIAIIGKSWMIPSLITFLLLFSPKSTVWIKDEVTNTAPVKIDHIPVGISFFTHISSTISHHVSKLIEETMLPVNAARSSTGGILYGAKSIAKIRDIQIDDQILLRNTKEYLRQCYMKPYVIGNFGGHRHDAIRSTDLLAYLNQHPAKCFGIKPTNADGSVGAFLTCTEAGRKIQREVTAASKEPKLMKQFASSLGMRTKNDGLMTRRIKAMTTDTFKYLDQGTQDIHEWMKQSMMLNANRESYDDWREKVGHSRVFPELVKMQATRGLFQQSMGSIVGGQMSEAMIPAAVQPTMLALVVMLFVVILPFALLPGGWAYITLIVKLLVWVCSWPIFYTIIHCIAMIQLKDSVGAWGEDGLSLIGQAGFTQLIMMKYGTVQSLISSVPLISFAVVFASPYALSGIAGGLASVASSSSIGSNMADGNLAMKQVSNNNVTQGQHNLAPSLQMGGGVVDDGVIRSTAGHDGKSQVLTEHNDQLVNNVNSAENVTSSVSESIGNSKSDLAALTERESKTTTAIDSKSTDLAKSIANGTASVEGLSVSSQNALRTGFSTTGTTKIGENVVDSKSTGTYASIFAGLPSAISAAIGLGGSASTNASNNKELRKDMSKDDAQAFNAAMEEVKTAVKDDRISSTNSEDTRLAESLKTDLTTQDQISKDKARTQQDIDTYTNQLNYAKTNSGTINKNLNEPFLQEVLSRHPELNSKEQALRWARSNRGESDAIARDVMKQNNPFETAEYKSWVGDIQKNAPSVKNTKIATPDSLESKYNKSSENVVKQAVVADSTGKEKPIREVVNNATNNSNLVYNGSTGDLLNNNLTEGEKKTVAGLKKEQNKEDGSKSKEAQEAIDNKKKEMDGIVGESTILRAVEDIGNTTNAVLGLNPKQNEKKEKKENE